MSDMKADDTVKESIKKSADRIDRSIDMAHQNLNETADAVQHAASEGAERMKTEGGTMLTLWRENANRMLRANERMMHGMMTALKLEFELGRDLVEHRMDTMRAATQAGKPGEAGTTVVERHLQEMERLVATMREISEEMRASFGDATKMMFDNAGAAVKEEKVPGTI